MAELLEGTVDVPGAGKVKKAYVMVPAGLAAVYVAWRWYQASRGEAEPDPGADGLYSSEDLSEYGLSTTGGPTNVTGNTGSVITDGTAPDAIDTNAEWTAAAVEKLTNQGFDGQVVSLALGEFLARRALDKTEATIARAAIAAAGMPPEGRPWAVLEEATTGGTGALPAPTGLRVTGATQTAVSLDWSDVSGAGGYQVYRDGAVAVTVSSSAATVSGLKADTRYRFAVAAVSTTGKAGARSGEVSATTDDVPTTPAPKPSTPSTPSKPRYRTARITRRGQTLSDLVAEYNRKYRTRHTWQSVWDFNLRHRPASTVRTLKARGPNKVFIGSSFWFPL